MAGALNETKPIEPARMSQATVILRLAIVIFIAEGLIMLVLSLFDPLPARIEVIIDATALILLSSPMTYFWVIRPYIEARNRAERALIRARDQAVGASRAKTSLLANMSHELRARRNAIMGFSEIMATRVFGPLGSPRYEGYAKDIDKVLTPFGQLDNLLVRKHKGTGLGRPLVKELVGLHDGRLAIDSEVGTGTTVSIRFPPQRVIRA